MHWRDTPVTAGLAVATLIASALLAGKALAVPVWLQPIAASLVYAGVMPLLFNVVMLGFCGRMLERTVGSGAVAILYFVGAYVGAVLQWVVAGVAAATAVSTSGAISAIVGAFALLYGERKARRLGPIPADLVQVAWLAAAWIGMQLLIGASGAGGVAAAIGGFVAGLALARPLLLWRYRDA